MSAFLLKEMNSLFRGPLLGKGTSRTVYKALHVEEAVIKVETNGKSFSNQMEWELWREFKDTPLEKWLAPCIDISSCGSILIQRRCYPVSMTEMPKRIPALFGDTKIQNWGKVDGRVVCVDYANLIHSARDRRLVQADWWSHAV